MQEVEILVISSYATDHRLIFPRVTYNRDKYNSFTNTKERTNDRTIRSNEASRIYAMKIDRSKFIEHEEVGGSATIGRNTIAFYSKTARGTMTG